MTEPSASYRGMLVVACVLIAILLGWRMGFVYRDTLPILIDHCHFCGRIVVEFRSPQAAVIAATEPTSTGRVYIGPGTYRLTNPVVMPARAGLTISGLTLHGFETGLYVVSARAVLQPTGAWAFTSTGFIVWPGADPAWAAP